MINKVIFIALFAIVNSFAVCRDELKDKATVTPDLLPHASGEYITYDDDGKYSNGIEISPGLTFEYTAWRNTPFFKSHTIICDVLYTMTVYDPIEDSADCYEVNLKCTVTYIPLKQFYKQKVGYRYDGTKLWTVSNKEFKCYDAYGMNIVKVVNHPKYCN